MNEDSTAVRVGQVWADNDKRCLDRRLTVNEISDGRARCYAWYDNSPKPGRMVTVRLDRFKPNSTGYRLVKEAS